MTPEARARRRVLWMNLCFSAGLALALPWFAAGVHRPLVGAGAGHAWSTHHAYAVRTFWFGLLGMLAPIAAPGAWDGAAGGGLAVVRGADGAGWLAWEREEWIIDPGRFSRVGEGKVFPPQAPPCLSVGRDLPRGKSRPQK